MAQNILGLDLQPDSIRGVIIKSGLRKFEVVECIEKRLDIKQGLLSHQDYMQALNNFLLPYKEKLDSIHIALPSSELTTRILSFPFKDKRKISQAIEFELEDQLPFDLSECILDSLILDMDTKKNSSVLAMICPQNTVQSVLENMQQFGLEPRSINVSGVALSNISRFAGEAWDTDEAPKAILRMSAYQSELSVIYKHKPVYVRSMPKGLALLNVADGHSETEAFEPLLTELKRSFYAFEQEWGMPLTQVYLCGEISNMPQLINYLTQNLSVEMNLLKIESESIQVLTQMGEQSTLFFPALGTALAASSSTHFNQINLRQGEFAYQNDMHHIQSLVAKGAALAAALLLVLGLHAFSQQMMFKKVVDTTEQQIINGVRSIFPNKSKRSFRSVKSSLSILKSEMAQVSGDTGLLDVVGGTPSVLEVLVEISNSIPTSVKVDIKDLSVNESVARMQGEVASFEAVDRIRTELERSQLFSKVAKGNVSTGANNVKKFSMTLTLAKADSDAGVQP